MKAALILRGWRVGRSDGPSGLPASRVRRRAPAPSRCAAFDAVREADDFRAKLEASQDRLQPLRSEKRPRRDATPPLVADWIHALCTRALVAGGGARQAQSRVKTGTGQTLMGIAALCALRQPVRSLPPGRWRPRRIGDPRPHRGEVRTLGPPPSPTRDLPRAKGRDRELVMARLGTPGPPQSSVVSKRQFSGS